jgi:hypothetical protein
MLLSKNTIGNFVRTECSFMLLTFHNVCMIRDSKYVTNDVKCYYSGSFPGFSRKKVVLGTVVGQWSGLRRPFGGGYPGCCWGMTSS